MSQTSRLQVCSSCQRQEEGNEKGKHKLGNSVRGQAKIMEEAESRGKGCCVGTKILLQVGNVRKKYRAIFKLRGAGGRNPSKSLLFFVCLFFDAGIQIRGFGLS